MVAGHGANLTDTLQLVRHPGQSSMTPALVGNEFVTHWRDLPVSDLVERIRISMPRERPGALSRQQASGVVAYLLSAAGYPSGASELPADLEALSRITFVAAPR